MLRNTLKLAGVTVLLLASSIYTRGQAAIQGRQLQVSTLRSARPIEVHSTANQALTLYGATKSFGATMNFGRHGEDQSSGIPGIDSLANWSGVFYSPGYDANGNAQDAWPYTMVGNPPESGRTTNIRAPIVPVTVQLLGPDGKVAITMGPNGQLISNVLQSPEFVSNPYTNGSGQFNDQMFRAEFADRLSPGDRGDNDGGGWHTILQPTVRTGRVIQVPFYTSTGANAWYDFTNAQGQPVLAAIDYDTFGSLLFPATYPFNSSTPVGAAELAGDITTHDISTFLFNNTVLFLNGNVNNCCVIGYHSYDLEPGTRQNGNLPRLYVLNYSSWLSPGLFLFGFQDITPWSHEMAETFNDPFTNNATPWWLSVDPFTGGGNCQNNLEVGDVVEVLDSLNPVSTIPGKGLTYHPQNMALFPWFAFESPSPAHLGAYSFPDETTLMSLSPGPLLPGCTQP
ncbi:MAG TPA: hypothetical protein VNK23_17945 [Candidatus Dormibacteraeota bacterium]|nr:hypothetical protein [Candidatus Dormibacteraeota bacterium]